MGDLSEKNFGLVIAFLLPGFVTLWGLSLLSPTVASWINASGQTAPTVGGFFYLTLGSFAAGLTISAVRWAVIDTLHHLTGLKRPNWDFAKLSEKLDGFHGLVENHYRYYQHYSNMFVAVAFVATLHVATVPATTIKNFWIVTGVLILECILLLGSRDTLRKYYDRAEHLLETSPSVSERTSHDKRLRSQEGQAKREDRKRPEGSRRKGGRKTRSG